MACSVAGNEAAMACAKWLGGKFIGGRQWRSRHGAYTMSLLVDTNRRDMRRAYEAAAGIMTWHAARSSAAAHF